LIRWNLTGYPETIKILKMSGPRTVL